MTTQNRTTQEIETPNGHKVIIYDYITGGEARQIQALYMDSLTAGDITGAGKKDVENAIKHVPLTVLFKAQELALKLLIVSVDGCEREDAYDAAMNLREDDLDVLIAAIDKYTTGSLPKKNEE
jgi:hypothetical protein